MSKKTGILIIIFIFSILIYNIDVDNTENLDKEVSKIYSDIKYEYKQSIIKQGNKNEKVIALTFDDGPDEDFTPQVLDVLKKYDAKATFYVVGQKVSWHPEIVKRQFEEGHELGNHTYTHINVDKNSYDKIQEEINDTQEIINKTVGTKPKTFRPPYRALSNNMCKVVEESEMEVVLWSNLDPRDWSNPGVGEIVNTILTKVENGSIVLLHDYNNQRGNTTQTIQALDVVIPKLQSQGYKFVTISELIGDIEKNDKK